MSPENNEPKQVSEEIPDEKLESVAGGSQNPLTDSDPPAEIGSPSLSELDPSSTDHSSRR